MGVKSASRMVAAQRVRIPLENGDHMDQKTFHELYEQCPPGFKAELIGGVVYVASPTANRHGRPRARVIGWLLQYVEATPGTDAVDNTTNILGTNSEPQPDAALLVLPTHGGQTTETPEGYISGGAELVVEVANSSAAIDLHSKRSVYETAGVKEYAVVLVEPRQVVWFRRGRNGFAELSAGPDGIFRSSAFPGLWLDPPAIFEVSPRRLYKALSLGLATPEHAAFVAKLEARAAKRKPNA